MTEPPRGVVEVAPPSLSELALAAFGSPIGRMTLRVILWVEAAVLVGTHLVPEGIPWWWTLLIALATDALIVAITVYVRAVRNPPPRLDFDRSELRIGADTTPFADIDTAVVVADLVGPSFDLALDVGATDHRHARFILRSPSRRELIPVEREAVAAMIALSGIRVPDPKPDPYDPTGKFSWMDYPNHRSKDAAIELVLHTPETGSAERTGTPTGG
jgi:hypothetical protein